MRGPHYVVVVASPMRRGPSSSHSLFLAGTKCLCLDPNADASSCNGKCGVAAYKGDGFCDDGNNNCGCGWDSGDCCAPSGKAKQFSFCTICGCVDPGYTKDACSGACGAAAAYKGDGFCDDSNNNCGCDWDQGDCCGKSGKSKQFSYCTACDCLNPAE